jgi:hypothetical protein
MKKSIFPIILAGMLLSSTLYAQEEFTRHEVYGGYGFVSALDISIAIWSSLVSGFTGDSSAMSKSYGPIIAGYNYYPKSWVSIGPVVNYDSFLMRSHDYDNSSLTQQWHNISLMFRVDFHYANFKYVQLYSGFSVGGTAAVLTLVSRDNGIVYLDKYKSRNTSVGFLPAFQINVFGIRIGTFIGFFIELGFGYNGIINAGFSGKF